MNDLSRFAAALVAAREEYEMDPRHDRRVLRANLIAEIERLFCRWRHQYAGWDISGPRLEIDEGFEKALDLLAECYEELNG
jgi:hypothetical protein